MKNETRLYALLATALMITTIVTTSDAQRGPGGGGQGGPQQGGPGGGGGMRQRNQQSGPMYIIKMSTVQAHLNLTQAQKDSIAALRPPQGGQGGPGGGGPGGPGGQGGPGGSGGGQGGPQGGGPGGPGGNGGQRPNPLAEILNENQMNRLNQLALQFDAPMSIMDRKSAQELVLTAAQKQELDTIIKNAFPRPQGGPGGGGQGGPGGPGGNGGGQGGPGGSGGNGGGQGGPRPTPPTFAEMQAKKLAAFNLAWDVLTAVQKEKWNTMTGAKFTNWVEVPRPNN